MAVGDFKGWAVQSQDAPAHVARILQTILLNEGVVDVAGNSFQVLEDSGANMNIQVGSGTIGDLAVVEGDDAAGQGVYVHEAQNATVTRAVAASDPSDPRIDLVVLQNYDDEADSSGLNDAEVEVIQGTPAVSPTVPALPNSAIPLAEVAVAAGVTAITDANITDTRVEVKSKIAAHRKRFYRNVPAGTDQAGTAAPSWELWPDVSTEEVSVPEWASFALVTAQIQGVFTVTSSGNHLVRISVEGVGADPAARLSWPLTSDRRNIHVAGEFDVSALVGTVATIQTEAQVVSGDGRLRVDSLSVVFMTVEFYGD